MKYRPRPFNTPNTWLKFASAAIILSIAFGAVYFVEMWRNIRPDFILASLVTLAFFSGFLELATLVALSWLFLSWMPGISLELVILGTLPFLVLLLRRTLVPVGGRVANITFVLVAIIIFYSLNGELTSWANLKVLMESLAWSLGFTLFVFEGFRYAYGEQLP